jgi:hypothetical protein
MLHVPAGTEEVYRKKFPWSERRIDGFSSLLNVSSTMLDFAAADKTKFVTVVSANVSWTASANDAWITVSPTSGSGDIVTVSVTAAANTSTSPRTGTVTVTDGSSITQAASVLPDYSIHEARYLPEDICAGCKRKQQTGICGYCTGHQSQVCWQSVSGFSISIVT